MAAFALRGSVEAGGEIVADADELAVRREEGKRGHLEPGFGAVDEVFAGDPGSRAKAAERVAEAAASMRRSRCRTGSSVGRISAAMDPISWTVSRSSDLSRIVNPRAAACDPLWSLAPPLCKRMHNAD
jgi:hypothetical protein